MRKKLLGLVLATTMVTSVLAGCGGAKEQQPAANSPAATQGAKELGAATLKFWFPSEGEVSDKYFTDAAKEFETKFPQIKIEITKLPTSAADVTVKLNAASLSGDYPDVQSTYLAHIASRGAKDEFADLKAYVDKWEDKGDIVDSAYTAGVYKEKQLGIAFFPAPRILTYRTDYFKEAGLDPAKPPKNLEELRDYALKLVKKDANGKVTRAGLDVAATNDSGLWVTFMRQYGSSVADAKNDKPSLTDSGAADALTYLASLKDQAIPYDGGKLDDYPFMKGNAAMSFINLTQIAKLVSLDPSMKDKLAYAPVPETKVKKTFTGNRLFTMGESSKSKDQAWEFIKFMMSKEQMLTRAKTLSIPVVRKSLEKEYIALNPTLNTATLDYVKYGEGMPQVSWVSVLNKYMETAYGEVYTGKKPAQQALKDADTTINKELEALFKK